MYRHFKNNTTKIHLRSKDDKALSFSKDKNLTSSSSIIPIPLPISGTATLLTTKFSKKKKCFCQGRLTTCKREGICSSVLPSCYSLPLHPVTTSPRHANYLKTATCNYRCLLHHAAFGLVSMKCLHTLTLRVCSQHIHDLICIVWGSFNKFTENVWQKWKCVYEF